MRYCRSRSPGRLSLYDHKSGYGYTKPIQIEFRRRARGQPFGLGEVLSLKDSTAVEIMGSVGHRI